MESLLKFVSFMVEYGFGHVTRPYTNIPSWDKMMSFVSSSQLRVDYQETSEINSSSLGARLYRVLIHTNGDFLAAMPHDTIYGLLGLVGTGALPPQLTPDCTKPYAKVYQEYTRFIFEQSGNLAMLFHKDSHIVRLPSWVPDLRLFTYYVGGRELEEKCRTGVAPP
jgi:hypothetical protein